MAQSGPQLISTLAGAGSLMIDGHAVPVNYVVYTFQEMIDTGAGSTVPGLKSASGKLGSLKVPETMKIVGRSVQLTLQDGGKLDVVLTDATGTFLVSGQVG